MGYYELRYSTKVWLIGLLIGPVLAAFASCCVNGQLEGSTTYLILLFPPVTGFVALFSCLTWIIFWGFINMVINIVPEPFLRKFWIMLIGLALTFATIYLPFFFGDSPLADLCLPLIIGYASGITIGVWYCELNHDLV